MRVMALQKRAVSDGVSAAVVEDAMDDDDSKASLIDLIVAVVSSRAPALKRKMHLVAASGGVSSHLAAWCRATSFLTLSRLRP